MENNVPVWLTKERLNVYPKLIGAIYLIGVILWVFLADNNIDLNGRYLGADFISFYAAGTLALEGQAILAYDIEAHRNVELALINAEDLEFGLLPFNYPPIFLLLLAPLAALPYFVAFIIFQISSIIFFVTMIKKLAGRNEALILSLAFGGTLINFCYGQNALLTTGLLAGALFYLDRKPILSGILIGLLTYKPHLGILIPLVLIVSGRWQVFLYAAISFIFLILMTIATLGMESWISFWEARDFVKQALNVPLISYLNFQSIFSSLRAMGIGLNSAYLIHIIFAFLSIIVVLKIWVMKVDVRLKLASLTLGTMMISPYILNYDLALLAIVISCLVSFGIEKGFEKSQILLLIITWFLPIVAKPFNTMLPMPWTPVILWILLFQIYKVANDLKFEEQRQVLL